MSLPHIMAPASTALIAAAFFGAMTLPASADTTAVENPGAPGVAEQIESLRSELLTVQRREGRDAAASIPILEELARLELAEGEKEFAAVRLERVLELRRRYDGHYAQTLMTPLLKLARIYLTSGLYQRAILKLRYAQHLTHRRDGVYSLDQVELIESLAQAFLARNEGKEAHREMRLAFDLSRRVHGEDTLDHVPAMLRYAAWFRLREEDRKARRLYHRAIDMLETEHGPDHYSLIEPLIRLSETASRPGYHLKEREAALVRADAILNSQPGVDTEDRVISAVRLGDFYTRHRMPRAARAHYDRAWSLMAGRTEARYDEAFLFADPVALNFPFSIVPTLADANYVRHIDLDLDVQEVTVTLDLRIDETGKVTRVDIVEQTGPVALNRLLVRNGFALRFRPRIVDGRPVPVENFRITETVRIESPLSRSQLLRLLRAQILGLRSDLQVEG